MHYTSKLDKSTATSPSSTTDRTLHADESMVNSDKIDLTEPDAKHISQKHTAEFKTEVLEFYRRENRKRSDFDLSQF